MHTSHELFEAAGTILGWFIGTLASSTAPPKSADEIRLAAVFAVDPAKHDAVERTHLQLCSSWDTLTLDQQQRVVDHLLIACCAQGYTGHLNPRSVRPLSAPRPRVRRAD